jgi:hypothetical protein
MKNVLIGLVVMLLFACNAKKVDNTIMVVNTTNKARIDEAVTILRTELEVLITTVKEGQFPLLKDAEGKIIPSQIDDLDKDGKWDELFFLTDLNANEEKEISVSFVEMKDVPAFTVRSNVRFADMTPEHNELSHAERLKSTASSNSQKYFTMEGPAWENEYVAFRNYYDARNGFDIFGKRTTEMVLDKVGLTPHSYHHLAEWGMDVLKVGNSLGAGALAIKKDDKIYRFVDFETGEAIFDEGTIDILADGPLRSIIRLNVNGWNVDGNKYNLTHEISIWGGTHFYKSKVTVSGLEGGETLVTGIVNLDSDSLMLFEPNDDLICMVTHDNQAYDGEKMGLAIAMHKSDFIQTIEAPEEGKGVVKTYMAELKLENENPVDFCFYTGWELQNQKFKDSDYFVDMIKADAERLANITVKVK